MHLTDDLYQLDPNPWAGEAKEWFRRSVQLFWEKIYKPKVVDHP